MPEEQDFYHITLSEGRAVAQQQNSSYTSTTIPSARIAENTNLSDIFPFKFEANESPFLLSNTAANKQKAITVMYTEAEVEGKPIHLILDSGSTGSIITYQLMQQLKRNVDQPAQTVIVTADGIKKTSTQELTISYQEQHTQVPVTCDTFNKCSKKAPAFEFEPEEEKPIIKTFMTLGSTSNWADKTEQQYFLTNDSLETKKPVTPGWNKLLSMGACISPKEEYRNHICYYCKTLCLTCGERLSDECNWIDVAFKGGVCNQTCQYAFLISEKVARRTPFDAAYNSTLNKLYHYPHDAKIIFDLAMTLINRATQENVRQIKESEYITYIFEIAGYNYKDEVECPECYTCSIPLPSESDEYEIEFGELEATKKIKATPVYLIKNQSASQLKYFNNNGQGIKPEKAHEIDAGYNLRYSRKETLTLKPKLLTKINLKIALEIPLGAIVQIASRSSLASKGINVKGGIIDAEYTGDITIILQNETNKFFQIEHAEKIAQAIYLPLINISGLQLPITTQQIFESNKQIYLEHNISIPNIYIQEGTKKVRVTFYNPNSYLIVLLNNIEIGVIHSNIFQQKLPQTVPNFSEIIEHSLPKINPNPSSENYHVVIEKLSRINMRQLEPQQQNQFKELIAEFADIFAKNNNDLGRTDLV
ncbi:hypothetical protein G9A89_019140 [Geosiphon pyriformis]|nr:hypothetical protein G9A89_019140 [Geosiphon pyriformis]